MLHSDERFIPPTYIAEFMHEFYNHGITEQLVRTKINEYKRRHNGKDPARIFVSDKMFQQLVSCVRCNVLSDTTGKHTMFGIPVSRFYDPDNSSIYLSDEEEW